MCRLPLSMLLSIALSVALLPWLCVPAHAGGVCPEFSVPPVIVKTICTTQEFEEHTFIDALVINSSGAPISRYSLVLALYDASGALLISQRVERNVRKGSLAPGESQEERFIAVDVPPAQVARLEITPVPQ